MGNLMEVISAKEIWEAALGELQIQVSKPNYQTWLEKTIGLSYQDNQFTVGVPNIFVAEYLDKNQRSLIEKTLIGLTHRRTQILFRISNGHTEHSQSDNTWEKVSVCPTNHAKFNGRYTFDSFIVGSCNQLAYSASLDTAKNSGSDHNPLFIFGGVGLGKTHLLQAIGNAASANNTQVLYTSAEQFTNELMNALRARKTEEFRNKFRNVEMLLIDDIQFISGKRQTEENFFHTFNELHIGNRQIVITSDRPPKSLPSLQDRLRSRLEWGLVTDIQSPDLETRLAILRAKSEQRGIDVAVDVLEFIALHIQSNIRELEGSLNRVIAYAKLFKALPTTELAAQALVNLTTKESKAVSIAPCLILKAVASSFQLDPADLKSQKRKQCALARQVAVYFMREKTNLPLTQIGRELGGRDPSFVSRAYREIEANIAADPYLKRKVANIQYVIHTKQPINKPDTT
jgi:chromosomal replication initiator protein